MFSTGWGRRGGVDNHRAVWCGSLFLCSKEQGTITVNLNLGRTPQAQQDRVNAVNSHVKPVLLLSPPIGPPLLCVHNRLDRANVTYLNEYYRNRLRALRGVDELVDTLGGWVGGIGGESYFPCEAALFIIVLSGLEPLHQEPMRMCLALCCMCWSCAVEELDKVGELDNTYVIYTSDNGEGYGQHLLVLACNAAVASSLCLSHQADTAGLLAGRPGLTGPLRRYQQGGHV